MSTPQTPKAPAPDPSTPWTNAVAVTAAILAALAAISSMLSERNRTEAMIDQIEASDQWIYYQAKGIKLTLTENKANPSADDKAKIERYQHEQDEIHAAAKGHQASADLHRQRAMKFSHAATISQIAIALAAISLLTKRRWFWYASMLAGGGALIFLTRGALH